MNLNYDGQVNVCNTKHIVCTQISGRLGASYDDFKLVCPGLLQRHLRKKFNVSKHWWLWWVVTNESYNFGLLEGFETQMRIRTVWDISLYLNKTVKKHQATVFTNPPSTGFMDGWFPLGSHFQFSRSSLDSLKKEKQKSLYNTWCLPHFQGIFWT